MSLPAAGSNVTARASGLRSQLCEGSTLLALKMAQNVFGLLEMLNRSLQARYQTVSGMLTAVDAVGILKGKAPELRGEYNEVEQLVRLLLVAPASSAEAERSFSALRRLKTWLRSTMTQH